MEEKQQARLKYYIRWYFILGKSVGKIGLSQLLEWHLMEYGMHVQKNSWRIHWWSNNIINMNYEYMHTLIDENYVDNIDKCQNCIAI